MVRRLFVVALLVAAASCGHESDTQTTTTGTTTTTATANPAMAATPAGGGTATGAGQPPKFDTESAAQAHCATDQVVWLNTHSRVYHEKGMVYYGKTQHGAYVCRKEADAAGDRDTQNGK